MPTAQVKVQINGADQDAVVDLAQIPDAVLAEHAKAKGFMPSAAFEEELKRRGIGIAKGQGYRKPEELEDDQEFVTRVATKHGFRKGEPGTTDAQRAEELAARVKAERVTWEERELKPQLTAAQAKEKENALRIAKLTTRGMHKDIVAAAAAAGVKEALLKSDDPNGVAPIVAITQSRYGYDPETDGYYVKKANGDGFEISARATREKPYITIDEDLGQWAAKKENAEFIRTGRQGGAGLGDLRNGAATDGVVRLSPEDYSNPQKYEAALRSVGNDYSKVQLATGAGPTF